jgi:transcription initiation factor TFIIH subunit 2
VRRGISRHLFVVMDCSRGAEQADLRPFRGALVRDALASFVCDYFDQNPIAQLGVIVTHHGIAEKLSELSGNPQRHVALIQSALKRGGGDASLQNALEVARASLSLLPRFGTREIVIGYCSLTTCDPGNIFETIDALRRDGVRVSIVGFGACVHVCRSICERTLGSYAVALDAEHFRELLAAHTPPPPEYADNSGAASDNQDDSSSSDGNFNAKAALVKMGFPQHRTDAYPSLCACHRELNAGGYFCSQCKSKYCELPIDCSVCSLTLVSSPHLARSYHHLFPVAAFESAHKSEEARCYACSCQPLPQLPFYRCAKCTHTFCLDCDEFIHESLHTCPGCQQTHIG